MTEFSRPNGDVIEVRTAAVDDALQIQEILASAWDETPRAELFDPGDPETVQAQAKRIEAQQLADYPKMYYVARLGGEATSLSGVLTIGTVLYADEAPFQSRWERIRAKAHHRKQGDPRVLDSTGRPISEIFEIAVRPDTKQETHRGRGVVSAMALAALRAVDDEQTLRVRVYLSNPALFDAYQETGLNDNGERYQDDFGEVAKLEAKVATVRSCLERRFTSSENQQD